MELVYTTSSIDEANEIKDKLENAGIPVMITGENVSRIQLPFLSSNLGVFVYINNQYDDAMAVIKNSDHQVTTAVDIVAFYKVMESNEMKYYLDNKTNQIIIGLFSIIVFILLVIIVLD